MIELRFATADDERRIVSFLEENWKGSRTLIDNRAVFRYQYMTFTECGFVLAFEDGELTGVKGYVPLNKAEKPDIAAAFALVRKGSHPMLNMEMQRFLEKNTNCRMMCSTGLNTTTAARIYPLFRYKVDKLKHYYMLGDVESFHVAEIKNRPHRCIYEKGAHLVRLANLQSMLEVFNPQDYKENMPYKDVDYLDYRYFEHPFYHYDVYGIIEEGEKACALLIGREIVQNDRRVFRIVDYVGKRSAMKYLGAALQELIAQRDFEYMDFYCYGFDHDALTAAGFSLRNEEDENIIPNYFEPFVQKNVDIYFFCKQHEDFLICKSDGDQDRPSNPLTQPYRKEEA